jgi:hypothetical protein
MCRGRSWAPSGWRPFSLADQLADEASRAARRQGAERDPGAADSADRPEGERGSTRRA